MPAAPTPTAAPVASERHALVPGSRGFIAVLAMCTAVTALGVDTLLPAFPDIREALGLAEGSTAVAALITSYLAGASFGLLPAGLLSDRFGRRPVMWGGLVLYVVGVVGSVLAPTLGLMVVARFVWGLGSAGPRVAAIAMVRDAYAGERMAQMMSFVMAVFILVPTFAPSVAAGILAIGPWQAIFWMCAGLAALVALSIVRLPETLADEHRRSLSAGEVGRSVRTVMATPGTVAYLVSLTALMAVFVAYLSSSEIILDQVFDLAAWFPLFFGALSVVMGVAMYVNGRIVSRHGLRRMIRFTFAASVASGAVLLALALATSGRPPFWPFVVVLGAVLFFHQMLIPNLNAEAMHPLAEVAGTGAAILGMVPGVLGSVIAELINRQFDDSVTPLSIAFLAAATVAAASWHRAEGACAEGA